MVLWMRIRWWGGYCRNHGHMEVVQSSVPPLMTKGTAGGGPTRSMVMMGLGVGVGEGRVGMIGWVSGKSPLEE